MASTGFTLASTAANENVSGGAIWQNPANALTDNGSIANSDPGSPGTTAYLNITNFGFSLPSGALIDGVVVRIQRSEGNTNVNAVDHTVRLLVGGSRAGDNKADTSTEWPTTDTNKDYGGASDLWGLSGTLTKAVVEASSFGISFRAQRLAGGGINTELDVDVVWINIYYSTPVELSAPSLALSAPTAGNPALTQAHQLVATGVELAAPTAGAPVPTQVHQLAAGGLLLSAHVAGNPVLTPIWILGASAVNLSGLVVGNPALTQIYSFTAPALMLGGHAAGTPALSQAHSLAAGATGLAAHVVGNPAITQAHNLGAGSVALPAHVCGSPNVRDGTFYIRSTTIQLPLIWVKTGGVWTEVDELSFRRNGAWQRLYRN